MTFPFMYSVQFQGSITTQGELAQAAGCANVRALLAAVEAGDLPPLPPSTLAGGQPVTDSMLARIRLNGLPAHRGAAPERKAAEQEQEQARLRHEAAMRRHAAAVDAEIERSREFQNSVRQNGARPRRGRGACRGPCQVALAIFIKGIG